jgi:hypothetical protein
MSARAALGLAFLLAVLLGIGYLLHDVPGVRTLLTRLIDHTTGRMSSAEIIFEAAPDLVAGDPVYTVEGEAFALQGRVLRVTSGDRHVVVLDLDPSLRRRLRTQTAAIAMTPDHDLIWVLKTLIPEAVRAEYKDKLGEVWLAEKDATWEALREPLLSLLGEGIAILKDSFEPALTTHTTEWESLLALLRDDIFAERLAPVLEREVVTRLESQLVPLAGELGQEIWSSVKVGDLMAISWIATKDLVGAAKHDEMSRKLSEVLERTALPVIRSKGPRILEEALRASEEGLRSEASQIALVQAFEMLLEHPSFQIFLEKFLRTWVLENQSLKEHLQSAARSDAIRGPIDRLWKKLEPTLEKGLEEILTREDRQGMDHQLVRVLRHVVLKKDSRYVLLIPPDEETALLPGGESLAGQIGRDL